MAIKDLEKRAGGRIESFDVEGVFKAQLHYKHVTATIEENGITLDLSGMVGFLDDKVPKVDGTAFEQTVRTIKNIANVISGAAKHYGVSQEDILGYVTSTRIDVVELTENSKDVNEGYLMHGIPMTSRTMVGVAKLPLSALVEITARAYLPK